MDKTLLQDVVVAAAAGVKLVTFDKAVLKAFPGVAVSPEAFAQSRYGTRTPG